MSRITLKVKAKSLSEEARIIKKEEKKQLGYGRYARRTNSVDPAPSYAEYLSLRMHRTGPVREASRETHLARAYLKGSKYSETEQPKQPLPSRMKHKLTKTLQRHGVSDMEVLGWLKT